MNHARASFPTSIESPCPNANLTLRIRADFGRSTLRTLFALGLLLSARCTSRRLGLLHLLLALLRSLLLLALLDSRLACRSASFRALCSSLFDDIERGAHDGSLVLDGTARALLGNFLYVVICISMWFQHCIIIRTTFTVPFFVE